MLSKIHFANFKRFEAFTLHARQANVLVGPNNSGKSSILDGLRILDSCLRIAKFRSPTILTDDEFGAVAGYELTTTQLAISINNSTHNYSDEDAIIDFTHKNGNRLRARINPQSAVRAFLLPAAGLPRSATAFREAFPTSLLVVPPLGPFEENERYVEADTVNRNRSTRLASRNFRNIWYRSTHDLFDEFQALVEASWPGVSISRPERDGFDSPVTMYFSENRRDREVFWSGFGFQIWLQVLTHILRADKDATLIMDEPDIYLHPDLQKRLVRLIGARFSQYFIATHSTEIINDVEVGDIVSINPRLTTGKRISTDDEYQKLYNYIGAAENADLARLARAERVIFVEGNDKKLLKKFSQKLGYSRLSKDTDTLVIAVGGFGHWRRVSDAAWTLREVFGIDVKIFSIFDSDFRCNAELDNIRRELNSEQAICRIWDRKEIENYLIIPQAIYRYCRKKIPATENFPYKTILELIYSITDKYGDYTLDQITENLKRFDNRPSSVKLSEDSFRETWSTLEGRLKIGPGKTFLRDISGQLKERFSISLSAHALLEEIRREEIDPEMAAALVELDQFCSDEISATLELL